VISISKFSSHLDFVGKKEASPTKQANSAREDIFLSTAEYIEIEKVANQVRNMQNYKVGRKSLKRRPESRMEEIAESPDTEGYPHKDITGSLSSVDLPQGPS
jgi:hypothetical protein